MENNIIKNRDFVIVGQQPWDIEIGSNCKNIALELSKNNRVLYVNSALDRITLLRQSKDPKIQKRLKIVRGQQKGIVIIQPNLWNLFPDCMIESITWIKSTPVFDFLNKFNNKKFANSILRAIEELGFKNIILFNDNDMFKSYYLKEYLRPEISIYYSRDFMLAVDYWKFHGTKLEPLLIAKSDICMANSTYLAEYCRKYNPNSFYIGQGCELEIFTNPRDKSIPLEFKDIPKPIIGYVGALQCIRLEIECIALIGEKHPEWSVVLVGPEDEVFKKSRLHNIKNIFFLGGKKPETLPAYINAFDVCINPQIVNQVTIGNYPRKIDEYLAMGKPVVASKTEAMSIFEDYTYLAKCKEDYPLLIEKALHDNSPEIANERRAFASSHTWENNVKEMYMAINSWYSTK